MLTKEDVEVDRGNDTVGFTLLAGRATERSSSAYYTIMTRRDGRTRRTDQWTN